jgi:hypothetical protein
VAILVACKLWFLLWVLGLCKSLQCTLAGMRGLSVIVVGKSGELSCSYVLVLVLIDGVV